MTRSGYPAARIISGEAESQLAAHVAAARARGVEELAPQPAARDIEAMVDAAFWASLTREEGRPTHISLAFLPPERAGRPMVFERPLGLNPRGLARLAPAVERPGIHLGVWRDDEGGGYRVWGTTRSVPTLCFVLEVMDPGELVLKYRRGQDADKYGTVAVLQGDLIKVVDQTGDTLPDCPELLSALLGFDRPVRVGQPTSVLVQLAVSMRAHGRGGSLLVVPEGDDGWRESTSRPALYAVSPFGELPELLRAGQDERKRPAWRDALHNAVESVAGLTAVDGATVLDSSFRVLAFGVKLVRRRGGERVERVAVTEPVIGNTRTVVDPSRLGGTRHLSAAQFIHEQRQALAMVASQDGRFTVFAWSPCEEMVHAHRVETLLL